MRNAPIQQSHSNAASFNFPAIPASQLYGASAQAVQGDSTAAGSVKMQASNDAPPAGQLGAFTPTNWNDVSGTSQTVTAGGTVLIPFNQICYQWVRFVWTQTTPGTSTITLNINIQGV